TGSHYNDVLIGNSGDNVFEGGAGADTIQGNGGRDTASYVHSTGPVQIDLNTSLQHGGDAEGDQLSSIENVVGSAYDDHIVGSYSGSNIIEGGGGADFLSGGAYYVAANGMHLNQNAVSYEHS